LPDFPCSPAEVVVTSASSGVVVVTSPCTGSAHLVETPLIEVSEEEEDNNSSSQASSTNTLGGSERASSVSKDIKESQNYEKQKQTRNSRLFDNINNPLDHELLQQKDSNKQNNVETVMKETASVGVQVNLMMKTLSSPSLARKLARLAQEPEEMNLERHLLRNTKNNYESKTLPRRRSNNDVVKLTKQSSVEEKPAPLRRGFTHDQMLGQQDQGSSHAWRDELKKFRTKTPLRVSELIGTFDRRGSDAGGTEGGPSAMDADMAALKQRRRGSLQIHLDPTAMGQLAKAAEEAKRKRDALVKSQRRKSTSTLLTSTIEGLKISDQIADILANNNPTQQSSEEKQDSQEKQQQSDQDNSTEEKADGENNKDTQVPTTSKLANQHHQRKTVLLEEHKKKKNWDYFEMIDHPKAISDKKLQQLKAKYLRRRTEGQLTADSKNSIKEENEDLPSPDTEETKPMLADRSKSVPVFLQTPQQQPSCTKPLNLSIDPLTGECLNSDNDLQMQMEVDNDTSKVRKVSTDSGEESAGSSRKSSRSSGVHRRRSSHLTDILEQKQNRSLPCSEDLNMQKEPGTVMEVRIDPLTGKVETREVKSEEKKRRRLSVDIAPPHGSRGWLGQGDGDDGFSSLPHTPTDLGMMLDPRLKIATTAISSTTGRSASTNQLLPVDDGIFTSSEETLTTMNKATSLDACDASSTTSTANSAFIEDSSRPSSASSSVTNFARAMEIFTDKTGANESSSQSESSSTLTSPPPSVIVSQPRRQSSPMIRPSSS
jgi:hypothetical protein